MKFIYKPSELISMKVASKDVTNTKIPEGSDVQMMKKEILRLQKIISEKDLEDVEIQQEKFGEK